MASVRRSSAGVVLDLQNARLWRGSRAVPLRPKDLLVLECLAARRGELVPKEALLAAAWPGVHVTEGVLKVCINRLRAALGDDARNPRFIATAHRRGYRLVGDVTLAGGPGPTGSPGPAIRPPGETMREASRQASRIVGRARELSMLRARYAEAAAGRRRIVFVSGEAGIGKTALIDAFLAQIGAARIARGQCVERYGAGEAYMPILEALQGLCKGSAKRRCLAILERHAPSWLAQMPGVLTSRETSALRRRAAGVNADRMLREFAEAAEALADDMPLILVVEDLQWSDASTLDVIACLARRTVPGRLLVVGTYRPEDAWRGGHPFPGLAADLRLHQRLCELPLPLLSIPAVRAFFRLRFPGVECPEDFWRAVHERTDGQPLFLRAMADHWLAGGSVQRKGRRWWIRAAPEAIARDVPSDVRHMIETRLERLSAGEREIVEVASVAGQEFSAASVAAGLETSEVAADQGLSELVRRRLLLRGLGDDSWPDGTHAGRYGFHHALYRDVTYEQIPTARKVSLHRRIALREEAAHGDQSARIAARLAMHFELAGEDARAARCRLDAALNALGLSGYREAIAHARAGLGLLAGQSGGSADPLELGLQIVLGAALSSSRGFGDADAERAYARAHELSRGMGNAPRALAAYVGLYAYHLMRGPLSVARTLADRMLDDAAPADPAAIVWARTTRGVALLHGGETAAAERSFAAAISHYDITQRDIHASIYPVDPAIISLVYRSWCLWFLGYPAQAIACCGRALALADQTTQPMDRAHACLMQADLFCFERDAPGARAAADEVLQLCERWGIGHWWAPALAIRGWARAQLGEVDAGIEDMRRGIDGWTAAGVRYMQAQRTALLTGVLLEAGRVPEASESLAAAFDLQESSGDRLWNSELHRLRGEILLRTADEGGRRLGQDVLEKARAEVRHALETARTHGARLLELRAAASLCRLEARAGSPVAARRRLEDLYRGFSEGFDSPDLRAAAALLAPWSPAAS